MEIVCHLSLSMASNRTQQVLLTFPRQNPPISCGAAAADRHALTLALTRLRRQHSSPPSEVPDRSDSREVPHTEVAGLGRL